MAGWMAFDHGLWKPPAVLTVADTAFSIAAIRAAEAELPENERLFDDRFAALFHAAGAHAREGTERYLALPFFRDGVRLRTRYIDDAVRDAFAAGQKQLVLLGAGFDARAMRMPEVAEHGVRVFEIDTADQLNRKRAVLAAAGTPARSTYIAADFDAPNWTEALEVSLDEAGFRREAGTVFVWEGVIGYIDAAAIDRSLRFMCEVGGEGCRVVLTFAEGTFAPDGAAAAMKRLGFAELEERGLDAVWRLHLPGEPPEVAAVSRVGVARR
jgi:methyltransferase (TIGR00027 family)